jgi:hypothetical protein
MNLVRFKTLALLLALSLLVPFQNALAKNPVAPGAVTLPLVGTAADGSAVSGTFTLNRFAVHNQQLVAIGTARVTTSTPTGIRTGFQTLVLQVNTSRINAGLAIPPSTQPKLVPAAFIRTQAASCGILHLDLLGQNINLLGVIVTLSPITLDISGDTAGPLGALVCEILALVGSVADVVGLLNDLLGLLTGLLGGLLGGLGG